LGTEAERGDAIGGNSTNVDVAAEIVSLSAGQRGMSGRALTGLVSESAVADADTRGALATVGNRRRLNGPAVHNLLTQANLYRMRGQFTEAVDCCVAVLRVQSGNATAHSLLGDIYRDQGKPDDAIQWYRMAVDLRPNPSDQAKLAEMERQRQRLDAAGNGKGRSARAKTDPLAAATGLNPGTTNLMGLSPRRWLRGIWIASLSFLVIVLAALIAVQSQRRGVAARNKTGAIAGTAFGSGISQSPLPQLDVQHRAAGSITSSVGVKAGPVAGGGLPSDQSGAGSVIRRVPASASPTLTAPPQSLPTAPVIDVRPLETTSSAVGRAPRDSGVASDTLQPMPLTGGLRFDEVRYIGNNTAAVFVTAPQELMADAGETTRDLLIRNVYRAARTAFAQNSAFIRATVFVQTLVPAAGGDAVVLEAGVDRQTAAAATPDTDSLSSLIARLQPVKWAVPLAPGTTANDTPGSDNAPPSH
jgi:hypothetical protein